MNKWVTLGLPLAHPKIAWATSASVFVLHASTASWDLGFYDTPEIALVAQQVGLGHPIGQPVHTLLGAVLSHIRGVPALVGLTLLSLVPAALSVIPALSLSQRLFARPLEPIPPSRSIVAALVIASALSHYQSWEPATRIEVYWLASLLTLWSVAKVAADPYRTFGPGLALGLAACTHAVVAMTASVPLAIVLGLRVLRAPKEQRRAELSPGFRLAVGFFLGLLPYLYVPLVALRSDEVLLWGAPRDFDSVVAYLSGSDYRHNQGIELRQLAVHLGQFSGWAASGLHAALLLLGLMAHAIDRGNPLGRGFAIAHLGLAVAFVCSNVVFHPEVTDYLGYLAAPTLVAASGAAALLRRIGESRSGAVSWILALGLLVLSLALPLPITERTRPQDHLPRELATMVFAEVPQDAIVVVHADHFVAPLLYLQEAENQRSDVVVIGYGLASSSWYWDHVRARHPELNHFELRAPGGAPARLQRFLGANPDRAIVVEDIALAAELGLEPCAVGVLVHVTPCPEHLPGPQLATALLGTTLERIGRGSPPTHEVIATVSLQRGAALWHLGQPEAAHVALRAGVPSPSLPIFEDSPALTETPALAGGLPTWQRSAAIGDPARNLFVLGQLMLASNHPEEAGAYLAAAAELGLPEAFQWLESHSPP